MRIFKTVRLKWWQVGALKLSLLLIGITIGAYWPLFFSQYLSYTLGLGLVLALYIWWVWSKQ